VCSNDHFEKGEIAAFLTSVFPAPEWHSCIKILAGAL